MKQQIIVSGLGGQGALTLTRLLAEAAAAMGLEVITSETHGMAQRGGSVISMIKVGPFRGPLIPAGSADVGLFLHPGNLPVHRFYLRPGGSLFVDTDLPGDYRRVDAKNLAGQRAWAPVSANLILLGFAVGDKSLFCDAPLMANIIAAKIPARLVALNLEAFKLGVEQAAA